MATVPIATVALATPAVEEAPGGSAANLQAAVATEKTQKDMAKKATKKKADDGGVPEHLSDHDWYEIPDEADCKFTLVVPHNTLVCYVSHTLVFSVN